jgi:hypothetical protein
MRQRVERSAIGKRKDRALQTTITKFHSKEKFYFIDFQKDNNFAPKLNKVVFTLE